MFVMRDLKEIVTGLSEREITRKQFLAIIGGSFMGMIGLFRILQNISTPPSSSTDLSVTDKGLFGEREYGHTPARKTSKAAAKNFNDSAFG